MKLGHDARRLQLSWVPWKGILRMMPLAASLYMYSFVSFVIVLLISDVAWEIEKCIFAERPFPYRKAVHSNARSFLRPRKRRLSFFALFKARTYIVYTWVAGFSSLSLLPRSRSQSFSVSRCRRRSESFWYAIAIEPRKEEEDHPFHSHRLKKVSSRADNDERRLKDPPTDRLTGLPKGRNSMQLGLGYVWGESHRRWKDFRIIIDLLPPPPPSKL